MAAVFNAIPFVELSEFLKGLGFTPRAIPAKRGCEVVFERANAHDDRLTVCIYTKCILRQFCCASRKGAA